MSKKEEEESSSANLGLRLQQSSFQSHVKIQFSICLQYVCDTPVTFGMTGLAIIYSL